MSIRGRQGAAGRLTALVACGLALAPPAIAQEAPPLDPSAPLDPMPDLGVEIALPAKQAGQQLRISAGAAVDLRGIGRIVIVRLERRARVEGLD